MVSACNSSSTTLFGPSPVKCAATSTSPVPMPAGGGLSSLTVNALPECAWTAAAAVSWITELAPASGQGHGQIQIRVAPNPTATARQADILLNDVPVRLIQEGTPCAATVTPLGTSVSAAGGIVNLVVAAAPGCAWTASAGVDWVRVSGGPSFSGPGDIELEVASNTGPSRSASVSVAGHTISVNQSAGTGAPSQTPGPGPVAPDPAPPDAGPGPSTSPECTVGVSPGMLATPAAGASGLTFSVQAPASCAWSASSTVSWITIASATSGTGAATIGFSVNANSGQARSGTIVIGGAALTVEQAAGCSSFAIDPTAQSFGSAGGTGTTITVTAPVGCAWTAVATDSWIGITSGASGAGSGTVGFQVAANTGAARTGTLLVAGRTITVSQASGCSYGVAPVSFELDKREAAGLSVSVTAGPGCQWAAVSHDSWIAVTAGSSGTADGAVTFNLERHNGPGRTGSLTVAGTTVTVVQK